MVNKSVPKGDRYNYLCAALFVFTDFCPENHFFPSMVFSRFSEQMLQKFAFLDKIKVVKVTWSRQM